MVKDEKKGRLIWKGKIPHDFRRMAVRNMLRAVFLKVEPSLVCVVPHHSPGRELNQERIDLISVLRDKRKLRPTRIQAKLLRQHDLRLSTATIWKVLHAHERAPLVRRRPPETPRRYSRPLPGDRVQMGTMKITEGRFQYTAIDDCTRLRVLGLYPRRTASNAVHFLENRMLK